MSAADLVMTREELQQSIRLDETFSQLNYCLPLSRAALADSLDLAFMQRETVMPRAWARARRNLPLVAVIIDTVGKPAGPATWRSAAALIAWAEIAVLQRQASVMAHYAHAAELAKTHGRVLLIETTAAVFEDWIDALRGRNGSVLEVLQ